MKKQTLRKVLLGAVCLIWVAILIQWIATPARQTSTPHSTHKITDWVPPLIKGCDSLKLNYRNPFLEKRENTPSLSYLPSPKNLLQRSSIKKLKSPRVQFQGTILHPQTGRPLGLVNWNGQFLQLQIGQNHDGWRIKAISEKEIRMQRDKRTLLLKPTHLTHLP